MMGVTSQVVIAAWLLAAAAAGAFGQQQPRLETIPDSLGFIWKEVESEFVSLAEAMPEDKWSFKPSGGAFQDVRSFGEQVKHVACANEAWAKQMEDQEPPGRCDLGGPSPAKTKAEVLEYLRGSFAALDRAIGRATAKNLLERNRGKYWGPNRLSALTAALWHVSDHYGQLVVYLRLNGIVPPASRR